MVFFLRFSRTIFLINTLSSFWYLSTYVFHFSWLKQQFRIMDKEKTGELDEKTIHALLKKLRINAPQQIVKQKFLVSTARLSLTH